MCSIHFVIAIYRSQAIAVNRYKEYAQVNSKGSADIKNIVRKFSTCTFWSKITPKTIINAIETVLINISLWLSCTTECWSSSAAHFCRIAMSTRAIKRMVTGQAMDVTTTADCTAVVPLRCNGLTAKLRRLMMNDPVLKNYCSLHGFLVILIPIFG